MKKIIAILITAVLICFAGCTGGNTDKNPQEEGNSIVSSGKIEGIDFGLGADVSTVKEHYSALAEEYSHNHTESDGHDHSEDENFAYYELIQEDGYSIIDIADARFYYLHDKQDKGIAAVATDSAAFGFTPGVTLKYEVEAAFEEKGDTVNAGEEELKFLAVRQDSVIILRYEFENYQLDFYFYDNMLITTVLLDTELWK